MTRRRYVGQESRSTYDAGIQKTTRPIGCGELLDRHYRGGEHWAAAAKVQATPASDLGQSRRNAADKWALCDLFGLV